MQAGMRQIAIRLSEQVLPPHDPLHGTADQVVRRLATDNHTLGDALYGTSGQTIRGGILVVFNDRIINRSEYAAVAPQDGDEVTFLPMLDGG